MIDAAATEHIRKLEEIHAALRALREDAPQNLRTRHRNLLNITEAWLQEAIDVARADVAGHATR
jgi:hypothetical protein